MPGAKPIYTSDASAGLDLRRSRRQSDSLNAHSAEWQKLVKLWDKVVHYINDPKTQDDAVKIMAARVGVTPEEYKPLLKGTQLLDLAEGKKVYVKADGPRIALRLDQDRRRLQCRERGLQGGSRTINSYIDPSLHQRASSDGIDGRRIAR